MRRPSSCLLAALLCTAACLVGCPEDLSDPLPEEEPPDPSTLSPFAREILEQHNQIRANATPAPNPPLEPLVWSPNAAETAQAWVERCEYKHNPNRGRHGENIAAATVGHWDATGVVQAWGSEGASYDYGGNSCASGKQCGHYTQIVWRDTRAVGCATQVCEHGSPFPGVTRWEFWVCNYSPPGNYVGERPY